MNGAAGRFPPAVDAALRAAGWFPGRWDISRAEVWADLLRAHVTPGGHLHAVFPAAVEAWAEFGGLVLHPYAPGADPGRDVAAGSLVVDPLRGLHLARTLADLGRALETEVCPLGEETEGGAHLAIDFQGRVYAIDHTGDWYLGHSVDQAVTTLLTGARPARLTTAAGR